MSDDQPGESRPDDEPFGNGPGQAPPEPPPFNGPGWSAPGSAPGSDEPTTAMPAAPPPAPPGWQDRTMQHPVPPPGAPAPPSPPGGGYGPPQGPPPAPPTAVQPTAPPVGGQGWGPPQQAYGQPAVGAPPYGQMATGPAPTAEEPKKRRTGLVVGLALLTLVVIGGIVAAAVLLGGGDSDLELAIDSCAIAADGSMSATGTVRNDGGDRADVTVEVVFSDTDSGNTIETDRSSISVPGNASERWSASGSAGDEVQRITCDVTAEP